MQNIQSFRIKVMYETKLQIPLEQNKPNLDQIVTYEQAEYFWNEGILKFRQITSEKSYSIFYRNIQFSLMSNFKSKSLLQLYMILIFFLTISFFPQSHRNPGIFDLCRKIQ